MSAINKNMKKEEIYEVAKELETQLEKKPSSWVKHQGKLYNLEMLSKVENSGSKVYLQMHTGFRLILEFEDEVAAKIAVTKIEDMTSPTNLEG